MILFIPLSSGQSIHHQVLESIAMQDLTCNIVPCCTEGVFNSNHGQCVDRMAKLGGETNSRNLAVELCKKYYPRENYVAMQDRDIIQLSHSNYLNCVEFLSKHPDFDAVALPWKPYDVKEHIRNAAFVIRTGIFMDLVFRIDNRNHICATMYDDLKGRICFLSSDIKLIDEFIK